MEKLQKFCRWRREEPDDSTCRKEDAYNRVPEELKPEHGYRRDCYRASQNILIAWNLPQMILKQLKNLQRLGVLAQLLKSNFQTDGIFCKTEWRRKIKEKYVWTMETTTVLACQGWKTVLETAEKRTKSSYQLMCHYPGFWFIYMWSMVSY